MNPEWKTFYVLLGRDDESKEWEELRAAKTQDEVSDEFLTHARVRDIRYMKILRLRAEVVSEYRQES